MYTLKQIPEDFIVNEVTQLVPRKAGKYCYFWLKKREYTTLDALHTVARHLKIPPNKVNAAGSKDKHAVTKQLCSAYGVKKEDIEKLKIDDITLEFFGYGEIPLSLGDLSTNNFSVIVRNLSEEDGDYLLKKIQSKKSITVVNYFDEQRFSQHNVEIGRALIKQDFGKAASIIMQGKGVYNTSVKAHLEDHKNDFIGALRRAHKKILLLMVHSYQSWMFNEIAAAYIQQASKSVEAVHYSLGDFIFPTSTILNKKIPLIGFGSEKYDGVITEIINTITKKEEISPRDFIIRKLPEVSVDGSERDLLIDANGFKYNLLDDEFNQGKKKAILSFSLPKGSYATIVVKYLCTKSQ